ncbi:PREDICTED: trans-resveratrol di-O-methyltransferase-like [Populus euphratica]|uniref:Trans-resveratrol di-O-methyltransferase-like n=1 Tax=Populus euphratica TaxID=75702 RepID=A0AAJ6T142_POPEU|nr:PREDICTED: trans-resveratrol di-O-methyltransferase-like [Populus euphratica]
MLEAIPQADATLLKWILHGWNDEECVKTLKQCKEAIKGREGGKVIIIDTVLENSKEVEGSTETQLFFDMLMMVENKKEVEGRRKRKKRERMGSSIH